MVGRYFRYRIVVDYVLGLLSLLIYHNSGYIACGIFNGLQKTDLRDFAETLFSTATSLLGFVLAAGTFLVSHVQNRSFDVLRQSSSYVELPRLIGSAIWRLSGLAAASLLLIVAGEKLNSYALAICIFMIVMSASAVIALTWIVVRILHVPPRD